MIETRDCVIIDTEDFGLVAVLPIGMSQICSCNWEETLNVGDEVRKGDPMGYFLFGGSDIVMVFQSGVHVELLCPQDDSGEGYSHILMGEPYARLTVDGGELGSGAETAELLNAAAENTQSVQGDQPDDTADEELLPAA